MSRPFSYNDENFTVIGNVLFVHVNYNGEAPVGTRLVEIPPSICDRLLTFSNVASGSYSTKGSDSGNIRVTIADYNGKCYLINKSVMGVGVGRFFERLVYSQRHLRS